MTGTHLALTVSWLLKVDIRIAKGTASHHVTANTNRQNGTYKNYTQTIKINLNSRERFSVNSPAVLNLSKSMASVTSGCRSPT